MTGIYAHEWLLVNLYLSNAFAPSPHLLRAENRKNFARMSNEFSFRGAKPGNRTAPRFEHSADGKTARETEEELMKH